MIPRCFFLFKCVNTFNIVCSHADDVNGKQKRFKQSKKYWLQLKFVDQFRLLSLESSFKTSRCLGLLVKDECLTKRESRRKNWTPFRVSPFSLFNHATHTQHHFSNRPTRHRCSIKLELNYMYDVDVWSIIFLLNEQLKQYTICTFSELSYATDKQANVSVL